MIDWSSTVLNMLWILGLAVILAVVSYYRWQAEGVLRQACRGAAFQVSLAAGVGLFGVGMAAVADSWWRRGIWGVLVLLALGQGWQVTQSWRKAK